MSLYSMTLMLILVMDPLGNVPVFLSILQNIPSSQRRRYIIIRETCIAFCILLFFLFAGKFILNGLHLTQESLYISGGIILFLIAIRMIFPPSNSNPYLQSQTLIEPFIVPLAIPLLVGPSTIATVLVSVRENWYQTLEWTCAIFLACLVSGSILIFSTQLQRFLGERGLIAVERLMGMVLTTIAVQMFLSGITLFFHL